jgi:serine/threonine protein kinase/outer membrane protein assembly factor BamB
LYCPDCGRINKEQAKFCTRCGCKLTEAVMTKELPAASKDIAPGTILDNRYKVIRIIERGGMGAVYKAEDLRLNIICAVKEMRENFEREEHRKYAIERFKDEALILSKLRHPNIPRVSDYFIENNRYFIVMDFVEGDTLFKILNSRPNKRLDEIEIITWTQQICDVLEYLHHQNPAVIYRDLKPANVMITKENRVMLIDFGIARIFKPKSRGTMIGTQGYAPPEQYRGSVEPRSDLYSLGATLHHLITGKDPQKDAPFSFSPVKELRPEVSPAFAEMLEKCLKFKIAERFANAEEIKEFINNRILNPQDVQTEDSSDEQLDKSPEESASGKDDKISKAPGADADKDNQKNLRDKTVGSAIASELENLLISIEGDPSSSDVAEKAENVVALPLEISSKKPDDQIESEHKEGAAEKLETSGADSQLHEEKSESPTPDLEKPRSEDESLKSKKSTRKSLIEISDVTRVSQLFDQLLDGQDKDRNLKGQEELLRGKPAFPFGPVEINIPRRDNMLRKIPQIKRESTKLKSLRKSLEKDKEQHSSGEFEEQVLMGELEENTDSGEINEDMLQNAQNQDIEITAIEKSTDITVLEKPEIKDELFSEENAASIENQGFEKEQGSQNLSEPDNNILNTENSRISLEDVLQNENVHPQNLQENRESRIELEAVRSADSASFITNLDLSAKSGSIQLEAMTANLPLGWDTIDGKSEASLQLFADEDDDKKNWTMFRGNRSRTGKNNHTSERCIGKLKWRFKTNGRINSSPVVDKEDNIYFGSDDGALYALTNNGKLKWYFPCDSAISSTPLLLNKHGVYFGSENGTFYALSFEGREKWKVKTDSSIKSSAVVDYEGNLYFGCADGNVFALSIEGQTLWTVDLKNSISSSPALSPLGTIFIGSGSNCLHAISPSGKILWKTETDDSIESSPAIDEAGNIYFGSSDNNLYSLYDSGRIKWKFKSKEKITSSPAIDKNYGLFFGSFDTYLYNLTFDGKLRWRIKTDHWIRSSPALDAFGNIYIGSDDFACHCFSPRGDRIWKFKTNAVISSSPCVTDNGTVYFGSNDGWLYALK